MRKSKSRYGNRKSAGETKSEVIRIRCAPALKNAAQELANLNEIELAKFGREAMAHYVKHLTAGGDRHVSLPSDGEIGGS